jgi:hypothetical protein
LLIKSADDKQPQIDALTGLLARPDVDAATRRKIHTEIRQMRAGVAGERDAAYEIEFDSGPSRNRMTIHDLRLEVDGRVAQIDHLIITRLLDFWVCESKHFAEGVAINDHGEWTAFYGGKAHGIASPVEQNRKHIEVLRDVFDKGLGRLPRRLGIAIRPRYMSVILISNKARITRPRGTAAARVNGLDTVMKAEQLFKTIDRDFDNRNIGAIVKVVGSDKIERLAHDLAALHRPASPDWAARFGLSPSPPAQRAVAGAGLAKDVSEAHSRACDSCGRRVSEKVFQYCLEQAERFKGRILCYDCQHRVRAPAT